MSLTSAYRFQFDKTGTQNVVNEPRTLGAGDPSVFVLYEGLFFSKNLVISKAGTPLVEGTDYELVGKEPFYSEFCGQGVYAGIKILTAQMYNGIDIEYHALGGAEGLSTAFIRELKEAIESATTNPSVNFEDIIGFPPAIPPSAHRHFPSELEGLDLLAQKFDDFVSALTNVRFYRDSNFSLHAEIQRVIQAMGSLRSSINGIAAITGLADEIIRIEDKIDNIESVTSDTGSVENGNTGVIHVTDDLDFELLDMVIVLKKDDGTAIQSIHISFLNNGNLISPVALNSNVIGVPLVESLEDDLDITDIGGVLKVEYTATDDVSYRTKITSRF